jgi:hypothetical protein
VQGSAESTPRGPRGGSKTKPLSSSELRTACRRGIGALDIDSKLNEHVL